MDPSFLIGCLAGFGIILYGIISGDGSVSSFVDVPSLLIVLGGTVFAVIASFPLSSLKEIPKHFMVVVKGKKMDPTIYIDKIVECAQIARKDGLLALEEHAASQDDFFLRESLLLLVDAVEADKVRSLLENDLSNLEARHSNVIGIYDRASGYAPAFGMIGTLIGLVNMLANLDLDAANGTKALTSGMATALITTFYGCMLANLFFNPIGSKLQIRHEQEILCKEIIIEGILSIQSGENPKFIREKLLAFLPSNMRAAAKDAEGEPGQDNGKGKKEKKKAKPEKDKNKKAGKEQDK